MNQDTQSFVEASEDLAQHLKSIRCPVTREKGSLENYAIARLGDIPVGYWYGTVGHGGEKVEAEDPKGWCKVREQEGYVVFARADIPVIYKPGVPHPREI